MPPAKSTKRFKVRIFRLWPVFLLSILRALQLTKEEEEYKRDKEHNKGAAIDNRRPLAERRLEAQLDLRLTLQAHPVALIVQKLKLFHRSPQRWNKYMRTPY